MKKEHKDSKFTGRNVRGLHCDGLLPSTSCPECGTRVRLSLGQVTRLRYKAGQSIWSGDCPKCGAWFEGKLDRKGRLVEAEVEDDEKAQH
jgi:hypothetical protein